MWPKIVPVKLDFRVKEFYKSERQFLKLSPSKTYDLYNIRADFPRRQLAA